MKSKWLDFYKNLLNLDILVNFEVVNLNDFLTFYKEWLMNVRLLPSEQRRDVFYSLFHIAKFCLYSISFAATLVDEVPPVLQNLVKRIQSRIDAISMPILSEALIKNRNTDPLLTIGYLVKCRSPLWTYHLFLSRQRKGLWLQLKKPARVKFKNMRAKSIWQKVIKTPQPEITRYTEATVYWSETSDLFVIMNAQVLGKDKILKNAVQDFIGRWRVLQDANLSGNIPQNLYIKELRLKPLGTFYLVELDDSSIKWTVEWTKEFERSIYNNNGEGNDLSAQQGD